MEKISAAGSRSSRSERPLQRASNQVILLKKEFPMTRRRAYKKSFWLFVLLLICLRVSLTLYHSWLPGLAQAEAAQAKFIILVVVGVCFVAWLTRVIYYEIERINYDYLISGGNLYLKKGLFVKYTGSFPLSRITDIYLHRGWGDYFWGLSSLHISTPTVSSGEFAYIHGLTIADAERLQSKLEGLIKEHDMHIEHIGGVVGDLAKRGRSFNPRPGQEPDDSGDSEPAENLDPIQVNDLQRK